MPAFESREELIVYLTCTGLGMSMLFSFNSFISAPSYVSHYYQYASGNETAVPEYPTVWNNAESLISVCNMIPNLIFQGVVFTNTVRRITLQRKLLVSMALIIVAMILMPLIPAFKVDEIGAMVNMLFATALAGAATAFFQSTAFALVANLPPKHMGGLLFGIGLSGTTTCLLQIVTKASMDGGYELTQTQSRTYFGVAIGFMFVSFGSVVLLKKIPYAQKYIREYRDAAAQASEEGVVGGDADSESKGSLATVAVTEANAAESESEQSRLLATSSDGVNVTPKNSAYNTELEDGGASADVNQDTIPIFPVIKKIWPMMFSCTLTFFITLTVFPGVGVAVEPNDDWFGVIIIFMFNFGDTCGRFCSNFPKIWLPRKYVPFASIARLIIIPLFFFCVMPKWIPGMAFPLCLMFVTGVSNGFIGSMSLVYGPQTETLGSDGERTLAGNAMSTALLGGCSAGSLLALLITTYLPSN